MYSLLVMGLVGEDVFSQLLIGMPDEFFRMGRSAQDETWKAVLRKVNEGIKEPEKLSLFTEEWIRLFRNYGISQPQNCINPT